MEKIKNLFGDSGRGAVVVIIQSTIPRCKACTGKEMSRSLKTNKSSTRGGMWV